MVIPNIQCYMRNKMVAIKIYYFPTYQEIDFLSRKSKYTRYFFYLLVDLLICNIILQYATYIVVQTLILMLLSLSLLPLTQLSLVLLSIVLLSLAFMSPLLYYLTYAFDKCFWLLVVLSHLLFCNLFFRCILIHL